MNGLDAQKAVLLILGMLLVTFGVRFAPFGLANRERLWGRYQERVDAALEYVPIAVLTAIIVPTVLVRTPGHIDLSADNHHLWAAVLAFAIARLTANLSLTVLGGLGFYFAARQLL